MAYTFKFVLHFVRCIITIIINTSILHAKRQTWQYHQTRWLLLLLLLLFIYLEFISDNKHKYTVHSYTNKFENNFQNKKNESLTINI